MQPTFYITPDFERALGLERLLTNFHIICADHNPLVDLLADRGIKIFSLEKESGLPIPLTDRNSYKILKNPLVQQYISKHSTSTPQIQFFKIAKNLEILADSLGYKLLNGTSELNHRFEDKLSQFTVLSDLPINFPTTSIEQLGTQTYSQLSNLLGEQFVVQFDRGHTGLGTIFISSKEQFEQLLATNTGRKVRISSKIEGEAWTLNGTISHCGVAYGGLSYQATGIPQLTSQPGGTVGNDWTRASQLSPDTLTQIAAMTQLIGTRLKDDGYFGLFGIDLIVDPSGTPFFIELNARQPASTPVHTKLMLASEQIPLSLLHLAQFTTDTKEEFVQLINSTLGTSHNFEQLCERVKTESLNGLKGYQAAQLFIRNLSPYDARVTKGLKPGVYNAGEYVKEGYSIDDLDDSSQYLIMSQKEGRVITPGSEVARIIKRSTLLLDGALAPEVVSTLEKIKLDMIN